MVASYSYVIQRAMLLLALKNWTTLLYEMCYPHIRNMVSLHSLIANTISKHRLDHLKTILSFTAMIDMCKKKYSHSFQMCTSCYIVKIKLKTLTRLHIHMLHQSYKPQMNLSELKDKYVVFQTDTAINKIICVLITLQKTSW